MPDVWINEYLCDRHRGRAPNWRCTSDRETRGIDARKLMRLLRIGSERR